MILVNKRLSKTLLFFVHLRSQQNRTEEEVICSYQIYSVAILILLF